MNLIGHKVTSLPIEELRRAADTVQGALDAAGLGIGFRSSTVDRSHPAEPTLVFTVTDAVPADHTAVPVEGVRRRPIILQAGEDSRNELEPGGTVVSTATETRTSRGWLDDPQDLFRTVKSLVAGLAAGTHTEGAL